MYPDIEGISPPVLRNNQFSLKVIWSNVSSVHESFEFLFDKATTTFTSIFNANCYCFVDTPLLPDGWQELPVHLVQIDSGITHYTWGINARNTPFLLELDNVLSRVNGTLHHVSVGQSGVWGIGLLGNIFLRTGITEENPKGENVTVF